MVNLKIKSLSKISKNTKNKKLLFIGKRSFYNLGAYDNSYLKLVKDNFENIELIYACSYLLAEEEIDDIKYLKIFKYNKLSKFRKIFSYTYSLFKLVFHIKKINPDFIHMQWLLLPEIDFLWLIILRVFMWKGVLIITIHNAKNRGNAISRFFTKLCYMQINRFVVHSYMCKNYLQKKYPFLRTKFIYIGRHGTINSKFNSQLISDEEKILNQIKNIKKEFKNIYIFIGTATIYKGFDLLLDAWELYKKKSRNKNNSGLIILGKVDNRLINQISLMSLNDKSIFLYDRFVSDKLLNSAVKISDFILLTHKYISHSGIQSSFLKIKKPFIFNKNPNNHMLSHELFSKTGFAFNNNHKCLAELLLDIDENHKNYKIDEKLWLDAIHYFNWENCFPKDLLCKIYR